jgi:hypothetical protein
MFRFLLSVSLSFVMMSAFAQLASEPAAQPTNLRKDAYDKAWTFDVKFDPAAADGYLVLRSTEPIVANPLDGVAYTKGEGLGNAKVFSLGSSSVIRIKEATAGTDYYFAVYAYNITSTTVSTINYLQTNPLTATIRNADNNYGGYYNGIDFSSSNVIVDLKNLINPHTKVEYADFTSTIVREFHERDTSNNRRVINCQYSNEYILYSGNFGLGTYGYSREHRMAFSWINFAGLQRSDFELEPEGCDIHALELVNNNDVNFRRSNYPFGDAVSSVYSYFEFKQGKDTRNKDVAEVWGARKGDVARALFYMMVCYNGKYGRNWGLSNLLSDSDYQDLQKLIDMHYADLPDAFEKARHEYVYSKQGNRNPFIDFPNLVDCIDFSDLTLKGNCSQYVGITQIREQTKFMLYPQPTADLLNISFDAPVTEVAELTVFDLSGKRVATSNVSIVAGSQSIQLSTTELVPGYYLFSLHGTEISARGRFTVAR